MWDRQYRFCFQLARQLAIEFQESNKKPVFNVIALISDLLQHTTLLPSQR
jgi:hypothetical protein